MRNILKQLKQTHSVFLHSLLWDDGLVLHLGHINPQKRTECMQSPTRDEVRTLLMQLVSDRAMELVAWEEPVPIDEEESEEREASALPDVVEHFSSVNTEELFTSSQNSHSSMEDVRRSLIQQSPPADSGRRALGAFPHISEREGSRCVERQVEDIRKSLEQFLLESMKQTQLQQQQELATQMESHREKLDKLLQESQARNDSNISHMQKEKEEWVGQTGQQLSRMGTQLQEQKKMVAEMDNRHHQEKKAAQKEMSQAQQKLIEELQGNQVKLIEELRRQQQQDCIKIKEEMNVQLQPVLEEMNKQRKDMQVSIHVHFCMTVFSSGHSIKIYNINTTLENFISQKFYRVFDKY